MGNCRSSSLQDHDGSIDSEYDKNSEAEDLVSVAEVRYLWRALTLAETTCFDRGCQARIR